ncbi:MAG: hypothetical protein HYX68_27775 [Planctomycetes bacterium]|jgi:hypothetical protein|nr:hypothetical protein [Planctomycetota bacterium]
MKTLPASKALEQYFFEARSKLLDIAGILDRINRGQETGEVLATDPRIENIRKALEVLHDQSGGRAERIQQIFSLEYDPAWDKPKPRY